MKKNLPFLLCAILLHAVSAFTQNAGKNNNAINYGDSAIYYLTECETAHGIDSVTFVKGIYMLDQAGFDKNTFNRLESISENLKKQKNPWYFDVLHQELIMKITRSDSLDYAIRYCKNIVGKYDAFRDPAERITALVALLELRVPLRNSDISATFDYYASRLTVYLEKKDSAAIAIAYFCLGTTYRMIGLPDMSIYNFKKSTSYIHKEDTLTQEPMSGLGSWMNNTSVLGQLYLEVGDYTSAILYSREAKEVRINLLKQQNVSYLNCNIAYAKLMLNEIDSVYDLLNSSIPLASRENDYPSLVRTYEIKGQYFITRNMPDSAESNLLKCKEIMRLHNVDYFSPAGSHTPDYFLAKVRIMQNRYTDARTLLEQEITKVVSIKKELLKEQKLLIEVLLKLGDNAAADSTFRKYSALQALLNAEDRKYRSKSFEVEAKISESENTINNLVTEKRIADITKKYFIGIAVLLLIVALVIFNRFRVTRRQKVIIEKEKHRSDELNKELNSTLENLKNTQQQLIQSEKLAAFGTAASRMSHEIQNPLNFVTNFSKLSEELVEEISDSNIPESEKQEVLEMLKDNLRKLYQHGKRASEIINELQEHARKGTAEEFFEQQDSFAENKE